MFNWFHNTIESRWILRVIFHCQVKGCHSQKLKFFFFEIFVFHQDFVNDHYSSMENLSWHFKFIMQLSNPIHQILTIICSNGVLKWAFKEILWIDIFQFLFLQILNHDLNVWILNFLQMLIFKVLIRVSSYPAKTVRTFFEIRTKALGLVVRWTIGGLAHLGLFILFFLHELDRFIAIGMLI